MSKAKPQTPPVPWRVFVRGFEVVMATLEQSRQSTGIRSYLADPTSSVSRENNSDPLSLVMKELDAEFGTDFEYTPSILLRTMHLFELVSAGVVNLWLLDGVDGPRSRLHPALILAAAEAKTNRNGKFQTKRLLAHVEKIVREEL